MSGFFLFINISSSKYIVSASRPVTLLYVINTYNQTSSAVCGGCVCRTYVCNSGRLQCRKKQSVPHESSLLCMWHSSNALLLSVCCVKLSSPPRRKWVWSVACNAEHGRAENDLQIWTRSSRVCLLLLPSCLLHCKQAKSLRSLIQLVTAVL